MPGPFPQDACKGHSTWVVDTMFFLGICRGVVAGALGRPRGGGGRAREGVAVRQVVPVPSLGIPRRERRGSAGPTAAAGRRQRSDGARAGRWAWERRCARGRARRRAGARGGVRVHRCWDGTPGMLQRESRAFEHKCTGRV